MGSQIYGGDRISTHGTGWPRRAQELISLRASTRSFLHPPGIRKTFEIIKYGPAGVSAVDYDNDGWYDVFFADGAQARLYRNRGDGTFVDATLEAGLPENMQGVNVGIFADFDNDGYKDVYLGCFTDRSRLFKNVAADLSSFTAQVCRGD